MGFRLGSRRRKEKQPDNEKPQRKLKKLFGADKSSALPPPAPVSSTKSLEIRCSTAPPIPNSNISQSLQSTGNRNVLFRDNRFPDGTTTPRIQAQQTQISPMGVGWERRMSPTGSVYSSASLQPAFPSYASYPTSYVPQFQAKIADPVPKRRGREHTYNVYNSVYDEPLPKPDYPLSTDGTGNSNPDSGLDTESRSSSGGKQVYANGFDKYSQGRSTPRQGNYNQANSLYKSSNIYSSNEPLRIIRPRGCQDNRETFSAIHSGLATPSRYRKPLNTNDNNYIHSRGSSPWTCQKEDISYRPRTTSQPYRCSSCLCSEDTMLTSRCTSSLQRIQLEEELASAKSGRRFRTDNEGCITNSVPRGLPRSQPIRGRYFEEIDEMDRYGRLPPVKRPGVINLGKQEFDNEEDIEEDDEEEEGYSEEETSDFQDIPYYSSASRMYRRSRSTHPVSDCDTSIIRL